MKHLILLLFSLSISILSAQITTGTLKMGITDVEMDMPNGNQAAQMMKEMKMTVYFKPGLSVTDISMMGMVNMKIFQDSDKSTQYMDMMGQKMKIVTNVDDIAAMGLEADKLKDMYKITPLPGKTKELLGFTCQAYEIEFDLSKLELTEEAPAEMKDMKMVAYVTEEIKMDQMSLQQFQGLQFPGAPLEMTMDMGIMKMTYAVTDFSKTVPDGAFDIPSGDYKEMSIEDLQKMGMGQGFGF